jgi:formate hydrogenlyase subunit 3/multisubunit Na+/H+ antiporter MnhD subunit
VELSHVNILITSLNNEDMKRAIPLAGYLIALILMLGLMYYGAPIDIFSGLFLAILSIFVIGAVSFIGIFKRSIITYAVYSTLIQFAYFTLDMATAILIGKSLWFAIIQFINFAIAGLLFALVVTILYWRFRQVQMTSYAGLFDKNQFITVALVISCLSLGGMPGFNIFVGEYIIYKSLFDIHPALTLATVFASLIAFIFYFRICYTMLAGESEEKVGIGMISRIALGILSLLVIGLGAIPQILFAVLEMVT